MVWEGCAFDSSEVIFFFLQFFIQLIWLIPVARCF